MLLRVEIRDRQGRLLTEWSVPPDSDGSEVDIVREVAWLRERLPDGTTKAEAVAAGVGADDRA